MEQAMEAGAARGLYRRVSLLGLVQILSWGSLYYSISVLARPVAGDLGLSDTAVFAAFSLGLLVSGLLAPLTGKLIDRLGGHRVMGAGSLCAAAAFAVLATAGNAAALYAGWILAGAAMSATLYDPAFTSLKQTYEGAHYRKAVTLLTLFGGFASTAFWPLSESLHQGVGWRSTYLIFGALHVMGAAIHMFPVRTARMLADSGGRDPAGAKTPFRDRRYTILAVGFACAAFVFSAVSAMSVQVLSSQGIARETVILIVGLIGPVQVGGRLLEYFFAKRLSVVRVGILTHAVFAAALGLWGLAAGSVLAALCFVTLYGAANGVMTIVRGTTPVVIFPGARAGALLGGIALPSSISRAVAPVTFAAIVQVSGGTAAAIAATVLVAVAAGFCYWFATRERSN